MGLIFRKRINLGKGLGINISKSGLSVSEKTDIGSFGMKGYSLKTGIPGVYYRKVKNSGCLLLFLNLILICVLFTLRSYLIF
jgi:hypothetical protein